MTHALLWLGRAGGTAGVFLSAVAAAMRITGHFVLGGYQLGTLLVAGIAGMAFGCFCLLAALTARASDRP